MSIKSLEHFSKEACHGVRFILTDVDDTLTWHGRLPEQTLAALTRLSAAGIKVIPVTGGCAGWSDMIARTLPVEGVITEGGGCFIANTEGVLDYTFWRDEAEMLADQASIMAKVQQALTAFPRLRLARDQSYRLTDVAIDYAQDVKPPAIDEKNALLKVLLAQGLNAKASSIHINVSGGGYDKFAMAERVLRERYGLHEEACRQQVVYVGDAPNDESMFARFPLSVGVANIAQHLEKMQHHPGFQTQQPGGFGFAEFADYLLANT
ncbi:HAD-IIB family hydrolase [Marinomonas arenicola]|uniref:HAD-IIB family hydrolase n=1 Tax=Marinomonas arenicola TaxID=569601 RepID=A0ABU9G7N1_9GAMM